MKNLELIKSSKFGGVECDIYSNEKEMFMTTEQLGNCLGYAYGKQAISKILDRNEYLKDQEFSGVVKLGTPSGEQKTRVFTEDGIYEVTMLAKTEKAKEFRAFIRKLLKSLRKGENKIIKTSEYQKLTAEAKLNNSRARLAQMYLKLADRVDVKEYKQICCSYASEVLSGKYVLPLPEVNKKTYSATEIGDMLGISSNMVGKLANAHNLKTEKYGKMFYDKSRYSHKEVETFRYYEDVVVRLKEILNVD